MNETHVIMGPEIWDVCGPEVTKKIQNAQTLNNKILAEVINSVKNYKFSKIHEALKYILHKIDHAFNTGDFMIVDDYIGGSGIYITIVGQSMTFLYTDKDICISNETILKYKSEIEETIAKVRGFSDVHIIVIDKSVERDGLHQIDLRIEISPKFDPNSMEGDE